MYYSEDLIEEVRMKNDIVDVISGYVRLIMRSLHRFLFLPRSRCFTALDAEKVETYLPLL